MKWQPDELRRTFDEAVWGSRLAALPGRRAWLVRLVRFVLVLARDLAGGQLTLRAMSLVYTTLLSLVPLLALSFSVLKAFGVYNQLQPMLLTFLEPLGEKGVEITRRVIQFIENINVGVLGSVGLALLLYTAVSLVQKIEESFNFIWHVDRARGIGERFSRYLSALLVGPILIFSAIGITALVTSASAVQSLLSYALFEWLAAQAARYMPYALVIGAFTFVYVFIPNTRVRLGPALLGGLVGGILWQSAGWGFALFAASSTNYAAIYSSLAILVLFMLWLYLSWLILLFGAAVAFYAQHPEYLVAEAGEPRLSNRMRERLALVAMSLIARRHLEGGAPWTVAALAQTLRVPMRAVEIVLAALQGAGILARTADEPPGYLPVRELDQVGVKPLLDAVRAAGEDRFLGAGHLPVPEPVEQLIARLDQATDGALRDLTVRDLAGALPAEPQGAAARPGPRAIGA
ncbi:MAG: YihY/virulence factor BrkB family protein [Burkholderiales bacterium]|nr:YihY/virulence factor BrkB family protein [Burkholderiales bacterium]